MRRWTFRILSWSFTLIFGLGAAGFLISVAYRVQSGALAVAAACLGTVALTRRVCGSRIILSQSALIVVNPIVTYRVPYSSLIEAPKSRNGTLVVTAREIGEINSRGFGGSLVDHFVGTTDRAVEQIKDRLKVRPKPDGTVTEKRFTRSWVADMCIIGAVVCAIAATAA